MSKYGRGLGFEFANAVKQGLIKEPFSVHEVRIFAESRGWNPPDSYIAVILANASSEQHSLTYKKYFSSIGDGQYVLQESAS